MKLYIFQTHSEENGPNAHEAKLGTIYDSKEELLKLCDFFEEVKLNLLKSKKIHMHFRDSFVDWNPEQHIDLEIN